MIGYIISFILEANISLFLFACFSAGNIADTKIGYKEDKSE